MESLYIFDTIELSDRVDIGSAQADRREDLNVLCVVFVEVGVRTVFHVRCARFDSRKERYPKRYDA